MERAVLRAGFLWRGSGPPPCHRGVGDEFRCSGSAGFLLAVQGYAVDGSVPIGGLVREHHIGEPDGFTGRLTMRRVGVVLVSVLCLAFLLPGCAAKPTGVSDDTSAPVPIAVFLRHSPGGSSI